MVELKLDLRTYCACDVFVAGGGPAGCAAAYAAAKQGAKVFLAEAIGCFGGMGTAGLVPFFTGYSDGVHTLCNGFGSLVFERMEAYNGYGEAHGQRRTIKPEVLKRIYDDIMLESGASFQFEAKMVSVIKEGDRITHAVLSMADGLCAVKAKVFIDATGDGILSTLAGAEYHLGNKDGKIMPSSLCSFWCGIDWEKFTPHRAELFETLKKAIESGEYFKIPDWHLTGVSQVNEDTGCGNVGHIFGLDATNPESRTQGWLQGRRIMPEYQRFYRECVPGFENAVVAGTASLLGVRESRRIVCDYTLVRDDFFQRRSFPDEIGHFAYGIDIHPYDSSYQEYLRFKNDFTAPGARYDGTKGEHYGIPYRALAVKGIDNLLVAGRCISADNYMIASIRVMPGCFITGQAAGIAASMAAEGAGSSVHGVDVEVLRKKLCAFGAYI